MLATHPFRVRCARVPRPLYAAAAPSPTWPSSTCRGQARRILAQSISTHVSASPNYDSQMSDGEPSSVTVATQRSIDGRRINCRGLLFVDLFSSPPSALAPYRLFSGLGDLEVSTDSGCTCTTA